MNESIIKTVFKERVLDKSAVGEFAAVILEVEGNAYICGFGTWVIDDRDPLATDFWSDSGSYSSKESCGGSGLVASEDFCFPPPSRLIRSPI